VVPAGNEPSSGNVPSNPGDLIIVVPDNSRKWYGCVWHHSASKDNPMGNDFVGIRRYHMSYRVDGNIVSKSDFEMMQKLNKGKLFQKPWSDIGYHCVIERDGGNLIVRMGRPLSVTGAHAGIPGNDSYNDNYIGLCVVGNFDSAEPDDETRRLCLTLTRELMSKFSFGKDHVVGHREVYDRLGVPREKTCPGKMFDLDSFRSDL
jgi:hypothetical protein